MSFLNKKSFTEVEWMLIVAIIIILVIGLVAAVQLFFPWVGKSSCIQLQRNNIDEVITVIEEVLLNGDEQIVRFRVEECTKCIWYNYTDSDKPKLEVEYEAANESFLVPPVAWDGDVDKSDAGRPECKPENLVGQKTCDLDITVNSVYVRC